MDAPERSVEGAVDVYLERLARLVDHGMEIAPAKVICMHIAQVWLDEHPDRAKWEPQISAALAERMASISSKEELDAARKRDLDAAAQRDLDVALKRDLDVALARAADAALKRDLEAARRRVHLAQLRQSGFVTSVATRLKNFMAGLVRGSRSTSD